MPFDAKSFVPLVLRKVSGVNVIFAAVGIFLFFLIFIVNSVAGKIICLVLFLGVAGLLYFSGRIELRDLIHSILNFIEGETLETKPKPKKILFDDFQLSAGGQYVIDEAAEERSQHEQTPSVILAPPKQRPTVDFQISDFFDLDSDIFKSETEPRTEFDFLLSKVLSAVKEVLFAHTVAFFWANRDKNQMVLEAKVTDSQNFIAGRRFSIENDVVSQIAKTGKPEVLSRVNPISEKELLRYYEHVGYVKSFVGVPVYFNQNVVAVMAIDSKAEDAYGAETLSLLGQFTKLISALIKNYTDKYDLLMDSELLRSLRRFQDAVRSNLNETRIVDALAEETSRLVNWDFLTVALYDETKRGWVLKKTANRTGEPHIVNNQILDFPQSIVGTAIKNNTIQIIDNIENHPLPRYSSKENLTQQGSLLSIPLTSTEKCYGALTIESLRLKNFSRRDAEVLTRLVEHVASALEILYLNELVKDYVIIDELIGTYTKKFFLSKLDEEVKRANDFGEDLTLVVIALDSYKDLLERYGADGFDHILYTVAHLIRSSVRDYDAVGRYDVNRFGIFLSHTTANEAYLWAEKIRENIASSVLTINDKRFSVTISVGICGVMEEMTRQELLDNADHVLEKAVQSGGNRVRVF